ncbi:type 1 glutamine amidotransferase domain-containing protein [Corynebacterium sanguinis]|uniref:Type 1 glutamine amidotransferase domain-containing protein n=1 Tax=Corynebacterium sanguinis TaxID=2594913 RepID=A0A6C1U188_9CORY|nr:type 1 glutamine amidotransferase domain-containing protein [Corynebacterium sanguinis]TVS28823.1 type 1 glutamine amidotransferase domain-containing protein [Corynebacterium sanguinis]
MTKVLMIVSASDHWTLNDGTQHPTGFWAEELVTPYTVFTDAGWDVDVATPGGRAPTVDKVSLGDGAGDADTLARVRAKLDELQPVLSQPLALEEVDDSAYDLVFYPGGHGPMEDLAVDETSGRILARRVQDNTPVALLCHAPAAVLAAENETGGSPFAGRKMTGFSNDEERASGLAEKAKWLLEDKLVELGVDYEKAQEPYAPHVTVDGALYSGQNPSSSQQLAERLVADLSR